MWKESLSNFSPSPGCLPLVFPQKIIQTSASGLGTNGFYEMTEDIEKESECSLK